MRILATPHFGEAIGHIVRTGEILAQKFYNDEVFVALPKNTIDNAQKYFHKEVQFIAMENHFQVNNESGKLDISIFNKSILEDEEIIKYVSPNIIIDDPGIRGAILHEKTKIPLQVISHGIYKPTPKELLDESYQYHALANNIWEHVHKKLSELVTLGIGKNITWRSLVKDMEFIKLSNYIKESGKRLFFDKSKTTANVLITDCSANKEITPLLPLIDALYSHFQKKVILCTTAHLPITEKYECIGTSIAYEQLVDENTIVLSHGGSGTLRAIGTSKQIYLCPGDIDQLANSLIANCNNNMKLLISERKWEEKIESGKPFVRESNWKIAVDFFTE